MKAFLQLTRNLKLRLLTVLIDGLAFGSVFGSMTIYYNHNMGTSTTGLMLIGSSILTFFAGLIAGNIADNIGRKRPMVWGMTIKVIGALLALIANSSLLFNPWLTYFGFLMISVGYNAVMTTRNAMVIDLTSTSNRKIVFVLDYWASNFSIIIGSMLSAWLFRDYLFYLLLIQVVGIAISFLIAKFFMTESADLVALEKRTRVNIFSTYFSVLKDKSYMAFIVANILSMSFITQFDNYLPIHLAKQFKTSYFFGIEIYGQRMLSIFLMVTCVLIVLFMTTINRLFIKSSHYRTFVIGIVCMTAGMIFAFLSNTFLPIIISAFIYAFGEIIFAPSIQVLGANMMDTKRVGAYNGVVAVRQPLASILSSFTVTLSPWIKSQGVSLLQILMAVITISLMFIALRSFKHKNKRA